MSIHTHTSGQLESPSDQMHATKRSKSQFWDFFFMIFGCLVLFFMSVDKQTPGEPVHTSSPSASAQPFAHAKTNPRVHVYVHARAHPPIMPLRWRRFPAATADELRHGSSAASWRRRRNRRNLRTAASKPFRSRDRRVRRSEGGKVERKTIAPADRARFSGGKGRKKNKK